MREKELRRRERQYEVFGLAVIITAGLIGLYLITTVQLS
jgi:hypothetical protein